jgi:NitT/TauT family transport system permease protein
VARNRWVDPAVEPLLSATYAAPRLALYPALALILGIGARSRVCLVTLECAYPIAYQVYAGARSIGASCRGSPATPEQAGGRRCGR